MPRAAPYAPAPSKGGRQKARPGNAKSGRAMNHPAVPGRRQMSLQTPMSFRLLRRPLYLRTAACYCPTTRCRTAPRPPALLRPHTANQAALLWRRFSTVATDVCSAKASNRPRSIRLGTGFRLASAASTAASSSFIRSSRMALSISTQDRQGRFVADGPHCRKRPPVARFVETIVRPKSERQQSHVAPSPATPRRPPRLGRRWDRRPTARTTLTPLRHGAFVALSPTRRSRGTNRLVANHPKEPSGRIIGRVSLPGQLDQRLLDNILPPTCTVAARKAPRQRRTDRIGVREARSPGPLVRVDLVLVHH